MDEGFCGIDTAATATADRQLHLQLAEAGYTLFHRVTNLTIGDAVTDADVHVGSTTRRPSRTLIYRTLTVMQMRMIVN